MDVISDNIYNIVYFVVVVVVVVVNVCLGVGIELKCFLTVFESCKVK